MMNGPLSLSMGAFLMRSPGNARPMETINGLKFYEKMATSQQYKGGTERMWGVWGDVVVDDCICWYIVVIGNR